MTKRTQLLGKYGEDQACSFLEAKGYSILERNHQGSSGELDIVAADGDTLVFIEVKTRSSKHSGHPFEAITHRKLSNIRGLAAAWCAANRVPNSQVRFDAIAVLVERGMVHIQHLQQVA